MSSRTSTHRTVLALLAPLVTAGIVATAAPANAIPFEGEPTSDSCLRVVPWPVAGPAGSYLFISYGFAAVLVDEDGCTPVAT
jgi:hypothetical protein